MMLVIALAASALVSWFSGYINPYYLDVIIGVGSTSSWQSV